MSSRKGEEIFLPVALLRNETSSFPKVSRKSFFRFIRLDWVVCPELSTMARGMEFSGWELANESLRLRFWNGLLSQSLRAGARGMISLPFHLCPQIHSLLCSVPSGANLTEYITPAVLLSSFSLRLILGAPMEDQKVGGGEDGGNCFPICSLPHCFSIRGCVPLQGQPLLGGLPLF